MRWEIRLPIHILRAWRRREADPCVDPGTNKYMIQVYPNLRTSSRPRATKTTRRRSRRDRRISPSCIQASIPLGLLCIRSDVPYLRLARNKTQFICVQGVGSMREMLRMARPQHTRFLIHRPCLPWHALLPLLLLQPTILKNKPTFYLIGRVIQASAQFPQASQHHQTERSSAIGNLRDAEIRNRFDAGDTDKTEREPTTCVSRGVNQGRSRRRGRDERHPRGVNRRRR
jgi:hypothetical protein